MIPLIDAHLHLMAPPRIRYPWTEECSPLSRTFSLEEYRREIEGHGIEAALFMEVDAHREDAQSEALLFSELASRSNGLLAGVIASARPEEPGFEEFLEGIRTEQLKGIRRVLHVAPDTVSQSWLFRSNLRLLGTRGLPFDLCMFPRQHGLALELIDACPGTQFVLDHCGVPDLSRSEEFPSWKVGLLALAERPNLSVKLSGMVASAPTRPALLDDVRPYLDTCLEAFGPERCLWGSDWPVCTLTTSLSEWIRIFRIWLAELSLVEQAAIAHQTARRLYLGERGAAPRTENATAPKH